MLLFGIVSDGQKRLAAHMAAHGLTPPQFYVLMTLDEHGGRCPIGQIAREHHLTNATMTGLVSRLEVMQPPLVIREQAENDRRSVHVLLTEEGLQRYHAVQEDLLGQVRAVLALIPEDERQDLITRVAHYVGLVTAHFPVGE